MRIARVQIDDEIWLARELEDHYVLLWSESDHPAADALREALAAGLDLAGSAGETVAHAAARRLAPVVNPSKLLAVGLNYGAHVDEAPDDAKADSPHEPVVFAKSVNAIVGPEEVVTVERSLSSQLDYEAELALVIGAMCRNVSESEASEHIFGFTVGNDLSARDLQFRHKQWYRGKSLDGLAPLGPVIVTTDELLPQFPLRLRGWVNGEPVQDAITDEMVHDVHALVSFISRGITLLPGDVVLTGTPGGVGFVAEPPRFLGDGDRVEVDVEGIGRLSNTIRTPEPSPGNA